MEYDEVDYLLQDLSRVEEESLDSGSFYEEELDFDTTAVEETEEERRARELAEEEEARLIAEETLVELDIDLILSEAIEMGASDVHMDSNKYIYFRILGDIKPIKKYGIVSSESVRHIFEERLDQVLQDSFAVNKELDAVFKINKGVHRGRRARLNVIFTLGNLGMVFRIIPNKVASPEELNVPDVVGRELSNIAGKLVVFAGVTGSGKSTSLSSVIQDIVTRKPYKVTTIELPVEYIYPSNVGLGTVTQRGVGVDSKGFLPAINSILRGDANIALIGEMRDRDEINACLTVAETGVAVATTVHISEPALIVSRLTAPFPFERRDSILLTLSEQLRVVVNQILVKSSDNKSRFALYSVLEIDEEYREMIRNGDVKGIKERMIRQERTIEFALADAVNSGRTNFKNALPHALNEEHFKKLVDEGYRRKTVEKPLRAPSGRFYVGDAEKGLPGSVKPSLTLPALKI